MLGRFQGLENTVSHETVRKYGDMVEILHTEDLESILALCLYPFVTYK
jgi:hypothetical protein